MSELIKTAMSAARAFYEASEAIDQAKEGLKPLARQQIEITRKVVAELGLKDHYDYRPFFYYDWLEFEIRGYYEGTSDTPVIECQLWYRGRCGDYDSIESTFELSQHIIDGKPELFEDELLTKLGEQATKKQQAERYTAEQVRALLAERVEEEFRYGMRRAQPTTTWRRVAQMTSERSRKRGY